MTAPLKGRRFDHGQEDFSSGNARSHPLEAAKDHRARGAAQGVDLMTPCLASRHGEHLALPVQILKAKGTDRLTTQSVDR